jgi:flagellar assembly factor FliW
MQSVTVAQDRSDSARQPVEHPADSSAAAVPVVLPELWFVHPIPGFVGLRRFVLVRLDDEDAEPIEPADGSTGDGADSPAAAEAAESEAAGALLGAGDSPLYELRSLERADVRFMVAAPGAFFSDYDIELDDQECGELGLTTAEDALVVVMLTVGRDAASTTANLLAPIVINAHTRAAAQVILTGSDWPVRAPLA